MNIEIIDEEVETPKRIGRCAIHLGGGCGRAIMSGDLNAVDLEKDGMICGDCHNNLFTGASWSGLKETSLSSAQSAGGKKARARMSAREQGRPIDTARPRKKVVQHG